MTPTKSKNYKIAREFMDYCCAHPELRFWQALRSWCGKNFILVSSHYDGAMFDPDFIKDKNVETADTFFWDGKTQ